MSDVQPRVCGLLLIRKCVVLMDIIDVINEPGPSQVVGNRPSSYRVHLSDLIAWDNNTV